MNNGTKTFIMFLLGACIGSGVTYILCNKKAEDKYSKIMEMELEKEVIQTRQAREELRMMQKEILNKNEADKGKISEIIDYVSKGLGYSSSEETEVNESEDSPSEDTQEIGKDIVSQILEKIDVEPSRSEIDPPKEKDADIYLIEESQFGEYDEYDVIDFTYYNNGVLTDAVDEPVEDGPEQLGETVMEILPVYANGEFPEAYVRNDIRRTDYRIDFAGCDFYQ